MKASILWRIVSRKREWATALYPCWLRIQGAQIGPEARIDPTVWTCEPHRIKMGRGVEIRRGALLDGRSDRAIGIELGDGVHIHQYACLDAYGGWIKLGEGVRIGHFSIVAGHGGVEFGAFSGVAGHSYVISADHQFQDPETPHVLQPETKRKVTIGRNVWGGCGVIILAGVSIGDNCVIGAGSVVRRDVPDNYVVIGNPSRAARPVKSGLRKKPHYE